MLFRWIDIISRRRVGYNLHSSSLVVRELSIVIIPKEQAILSPSICIHLSIKWWINVFIYLDRDMVILLNSLVWDVFLYSWKRFI